MLRKSRVALAVVVFTALTAYFLDFSETVPHFVRWLAKIQLLPALAGALDGVVLSLVIVAALAILTLLFGRIYCSCLCPLGILQDLISRISVLLSRKKRKVYRYGSPRTRLRYSLFIACALALILNHWGILRLSLPVGLFDPYANFGRIVTHVFYPFYALGNNLIAMIARHFGNFRFYLVRGSVQDVFTLVVAVLSLALIGIMAGRYGRIYCNTVCPVGTLLGILSRQSLLHVRINHAKCIGCRLCETACKGGCIDIEHKTIDYSRCVVCFDCLNSCKKKAIQYSRSSELSVTVHERPTENFYSAVSPVTDFSKRRFLEGTAGLFLTGNLFSLFENISAQEPVNPNAEAAPGGLPISKNGKVGYKVEHAVSPPGSVSEDHLAARCTSCNLCIAKCPQHAIKPAFLDYGPGGMMLPVMKFSTEVFCNYDCTICGEVCPADAIKPLTLEEKHLTQIGHVVFIKENCVVFTEETNCGACAEHCPTQAVRMIDYKGNLTIPEAREQYCVGCGACESICPVEPFKAIHVEGNRVHKQAELPPQEEKVEVKMDDFGF